jgi:hypothetical protein
MLNATHILTKKPRCIGASSSGEIYWFSKYQQRGLFLPMQVMEVYCSHPEQEKILFKNKMSF